jgi:radical SAM superfamily enzyme YgiQ (UPF0313 family)
MLVALINPSDEAVYGKGERQPIRRPPLGLAYLAGGLQAAGHRTIIIDLALDEVTPEVKIPKMLEQSPDLIAITATTPVFPEAIKLVSRLKRLRPDLPVAVGGNHASALPDLSLRETEADYIFVGDGEAGFAELVSSLEDELHSRKSIIRGEPITDLDSVPPPAWNRLDLGCYKDSIDGSLESCATMITGRGCIGRCRFCQGESQRIRQHSVDRVLNEIEILYSEYGIRMIFFADDVFSYPKKRIQSLSAEMRRRFPDLVYSCHVRLDTVDSEIIENLLDSGCRLVRPGIESGSDTILRAMGKRITTDTIKKKVKLLKEADLPFRASYMLGWPGETEEDMTSTIEFAGEIDAEVSSFAAVTPLPGTPLWDDLLKAYPDRKTWDWGSFRFYGEPTFNLSAVDYDTLVGFLKRARKSFSLKNGRGKMVASRSKGA